MDIAELFVQPPQMLRTSTLCNAATIDNRKLSAIISHLQYEFADYRYTVYRTAAKIVTLQKVFHTSRMHYKLVLAVLQRHGMRDAGVNLMIPPFQLHALIRDIYLACEKLGHFSKSTSYQLDSATEVLSNFFWHIFDPHRRHSISMLEIKVTFLLLSKLYTTEQLVAEFFKLISDDRTKCITKFNFEYLVNTLIKLITFIGEGSAYGAHNLQLILEQVFARCHKQEGLDEYKFQNLWTNTQTGFIIYANLIKLIKRMEDTEKLIHSNSCAGCCAEKIIGLRFKCGVCKNISLCLKCFGTGFSNNKHEHAHHMYEVFAEDAPPKKFSHYFAKLCNFFFGNKNSTNDDTKGFCNDANEASTGNETEMVTITSNASTISSVATTTVPNVAISTQKRKRESPEQQLNQIMPPIARLSNTAVYATNASIHLQTIINRLQLQNFKLEFQLHCIATATHAEISAFLSAHQEFLIEMIKEMRNFSLTTANPINYLPTASTPYRNAEAQNEDIISDIQHPNDVAIDDRVDENLTHSINGADLNRSYLDANKSDYSLKDLSLWFNQRRVSSPARTELPTNFERTDAPSFLNMRDTELSNFKRLLSKVKEIVEDCFSDHGELSAATQNLEHVLDSMILTEESRRSGT